MRVVHVISHKKNVGTAVQGYLKWVPSHIGDSDRGTDGRMYGHIDGQSHDCYATTKISWLDYIDR